MDNTTWTKSKWSYDDLNGKSVEFRIPFETGIVHEVGKFLVRQNPDGLLAIDISTDKPGNFWGVRVFTRYPLTQFAANRIERHPNQPDDFLLV